MADIIQIRRDTAANFTAANPVLAQGEPALEIDSLKEKLGDGVKDWITLGYRTGAGTSTVETFTATALQTVFNLSTTPINVDVYVDRVYQLLGIDYTISTNVVTLTDTQTVGSIISIRKY